MLAQSATNGLGSHVMDLIAYSKTSFFSFLVSYASYFRCAHMHVRLNRCDRVSRGWSLQLGIRKFEMGDGLGVIGP